MLSQEEQAEIVRRRLICAECPFTSSNAIKDGYKTSRIDEHCIMCGCGINRKTASLDSNCGIDCCNDEPIGSCGCADKDLKAFNKEFKINVKPKWTAFKKTNDEQQTESTD